MELRRTNYCLAVRFEILGEMFRLGGRGRKRRRVKMRTKVELSSISYWCTVISSLSVRKVQALKRASDSGFGDEDPAAKVSRSGS